MKIINTSNIFGTVKEKSNYKLENPDVGENTVFKTEDFNTENLFKDPIQEMIKEFKEARKPLKKNTFTKKKKNKKRRKNRK